MKIQQVQMVAYLGKRFTLDHIEPCDDSAFPLPLLSGVGATFGAARQPCCGDGSIASPGGCHGGPSSRCRGRKRGKEVAEGFRYCFEGHLGSAKSAPAFCP